MVLVKCPDCERMISDCAPACIGCGRPMELPVPPKQPNPQSPCLPSAADTYTQFQKFPTKYRVSANGIDYGLHTISEIHRKIAIGELPDTLLVAGRPVSEYIKSQLPSFPAPMSPGISDKSDQASHSMGINVAALRIERPSPPPAQSQEVISSERRTDARSTVQSELAGRGSRLGAVFIDFFIFVASMVPGVLILSLSKGNSRQEWLGIGFMGAAFLCLAITQTVLISRDGQSLGKKAVHIRIVKVKDETNPGFLKACFLRGFVVSVIGAIPYAGWIFVLVDSCFIFRDDRRCLHDLIAETKVIIA